jgi:hypothetical protein
MKLSMITWAPFAKSPNYASQMTSAFGFAKAYPYSNPETPYSDSKELVTTNFAYPASRLFRGRYFFRSVF